MEAFPGLSRPGLSHSVGFRAGAVLGLLAHEYVYKYFRKFFRTYSRSRLRSADRT